MLSKKQWESVWRQYDAWRTANYFRSITHHEECAIESLVNKHSKRTKAKRKK